MHINAPLPRDPVCARTGNDYSALAHDPDSIGKSLCCQGFIGQGSKAGRAPGGRVPTTFRRHSILCDDPGAAYFARMKIVISSAERDWRGTDNVTWTLVTGLRRRGHEVLVLCRSDSLL